MHSLRNQKLWNETLKLHNGIDIYECQTIVIENARMANSILMLFVQRNVLDKG